MDVQSLLWTLLASYWWVPPLGLVPLIVRSARFKGWFGEQLVRSRLHRHLDRTRYVTLHDVTLQTPDGTTQIDHVVVSPYGVFVIETRNMDGWIFGSEKQPVWTQKFPRKSFRFQNPLRQKYKHVKAIESKNRDAGQRVLRRWHDGLHQVISRGAAQR